MNTQPSAVMPQIGRPTSSNDPTSFGLEITRLTGELLADTTQMAPYTHYLRASLEDFDIITDVPTAVDTCRPYEYVNIRGNECVNCTALTGYKKGIFPLHIDSSFIHRSCDFDASKTAVVSEDNFGMYDSTNPKFRCTSNSDDTTQFWIGGK